MRTDGDGFSLTILDPDNHDPNSWDEKDSWRASAFVGGSPTWDDTGILPDPGSVVINELLAHSHLGSDWIELYNSTNEPINIGGWFLSDNDSNMMKFEIAEGTIIEPDTYEVFYETTHFEQVSTDPGRLIPFALSENGEEIYLSSASGGVLTGYQEFEDFGASQRDVSFGRHYKSSTGNFNFVSMSQKTPGQANAYTKVGPIVISEIMYHPEPDGDAEFIELYNTTDTAVDLYDNGENVGWKLFDSGGIDYNFPSGVSVPAHGYLLLVKNITAFNSTYTGVPVSVDVFEWGSGGLDNGGEKLQLSMPGDVDEFDTRYYIRIDRVNYSDGSHPENCPGGIDLWPTGPDTGDYSLTRTNTNLYGNDPNSWHQAVPSPGKLSAE